jgi:CDP-glycerol glycerophosphotransferase (TagB/SpsB family)
LWIGIYKGFNALKSFYKNIFFIFSYIIPKKEGLWVFLPEHFKNNTLQGNLGSVLEYIANADWDISLKCRNLKSHDISGKAYLDKNSCKPIYSIYSLYVILRAEVLIIDTGTHIPGRFDVVQLWHGTGFKNIGFLNKTKRNKKNKKWFYSFDAEEKSKGKQIVFSLASSEADAEQKKISFQTESVFVTGSPVNDTLFKNPEQMQTFKDTLSFTRFNKIIAYAPTYRDSNQFSPFTEPFLKQLSSWLEKQNYVFLVRTHPLDRAFKVGNRYPNIIDTSSLNLDLQSFLSVTDLLISDYSSISTDFSLLERPIIFYNYDYEAYSQSSRDFYFDLDKVLPGPFCFKESDLMQLISDELSTKNRSDNYHEFSSMFHSFRDKNSSQRTAEKILEVVLKNRKRV